MDEITNRLAQKALSRRNFLAGAGVATAATLTGCSPSTTYTPPTVTSPTSAPALADSDVLNFALNLEYLEAEFYLRGVTGSGLSSTDANGTPNVTVKGSSTKVAFSSSFTANLAAELAMTELQHVRIVQAAIKTVASGTPIAEPAIDLYNSCNTIAAAAGIGTFDPFASETNFFAAAAILEAIGVTAYTGAAVLISNATILSAAAGIQAAESYHTAATRAIVASTAAATGMSASLTAFQAIQGVISTLGGGSVTVLTPGTSTAGMATNVGSTIIAADSNAIGFARTVDQVLHLAYGTGGGAGVSSGGFFPSGLNGNVKTTAS